MRASPAPLGRCSGALVSPRHINVWEVLLNQPELVETDKMELRKPEWGQCNISSVHMEPQVTGKKVRSCVIQRPMSVSRGTMADLAPWHMSVLLCFLDHVEIMAIHTAKQGSPQSHSCSVHGGYVTLPHQATILNVSLLSRLQVLKDKNCLFFLWFSDTYVSSLTWTTPWYVMAERFMQILFSMSLMCDLCPMLHSAWWMVDPH